MNACLLPHEEEDFKAKALKNPFQPLTSASLFYEWIENDMVQRMTSY